MHTSRIFIVTNSVLCQCGSKHTNQQLIITNNATVAGWFILALFVYIWLAWIPPVDALRATDKSRTQPTGDQQGTHQRQRISQSSVRQRDDQISRRGSSIIGRFSVLHSPEHGDRSRANTQNAGHRISTSARFTANQSQNVFLPPMGGSQLQNSSMIREESGSTSAQQESAQHESAQNVSAQAQHEPSKHESSKHESSKHEFTQPESAQHESAQPESVQHESVQLESVQHESVQLESAQLESALHESAQQEFVQHMSETA